MHKQCGRKSNDIGSLKIHLHGPVLWFAGTATAKTSNHEMKRDHLQKAKPQALDRANLQQLCRNVSGHPRFTQFARQQNIDNDARDDFVDPSPNNYVALKTFSKTFTECLAIYKGTNGSVRFKIRGSDGKQKKIILGVHCTYL